MAEPKLSQADAPNLRGRPQDEGKYAAIIAAARAYFFEIGYGATSIEAIAKRAGVSKVTVYNRFGDKSALFTTVVQAECGMMRNLFAPMQSSNMALRDQLIMFGEGMMAFLARDEMIRFERHLASEVERDPEIGPRFLEAGPRQMCKWLATMLQQASDDGHILVKEPQIAAEMLAGMIKGFADMERRHGVMEPLDSPLSKKRIRYAVDAFLKAHQP